MKRKFLLGTLSVLMALSFVACGSTEKKDALKDGNYEVETKDVDAHGYISNLTIEVKDGKIESASYHASKDGKNKRDDADYNKTMENVSKTNPAKFEPALEEALVKKQAAEVDTITGATNSSEEFKKLATKALENAKAGNKEKALI